MNVVIRVDSSFTMGSGHVMRCLTLADALRDHGAQVMFLCCELPGNLIPLVEGKGYPVFRLAAPSEDDEFEPENTHAAWLGVPWQVDADETSAVLKQLPRQEWLIIDNYAIDIQWEQQICPYVGRIMVIDDLADRRHECDLLIDQNLYEKMETRYDALVPKECKQLLGPRYAMLRPEFKEARRTLRERDGRVLRILIFFGGSDITNETAKALAAMQMLDRNDIFVDVVVGCANSHKEEIENLCRSMANTVCHCQVDNMAELMAVADLAIGAGGTATWERCAVGIPSIITAVADNQRELAETGARNGLFFYLGEAHSFTSERLLNVLKFFLSFPEALQNYSANGLMAVDANGANRLANLLMPPQITIRRASLEDCDSVYEWRNAEETRRYIFDADAIPLETHRIWYNQTLENPNRILLVGEIDKKPVGVLRYDLTEYEALISVYLVPGGQGQGIGSQLIRCGSQWVRENYPHIRVINAEIFRENIASLRAFETAGYKEHHLIFQEAL